MIAHLRFRNRSVFIRGLHHTVHFFGQADAPDGAGIDNSRTTSFNRGLNDVASAPDVGRIHGTVVTQPEVIAGSQMKAPIASAHGSAELSLIADIAGNAFEFRSFQAAQIAVRPEQSFHAMAP